MFGLTKLLPFGSLLKYGLIVAVVGGAALYVWHLHATTVAQSAVIKKEQTQIAQLVAVNKQSAVAATNAMAQAKKAQTALSTFLAQSVATSGSLGGQIATIQAAPAPQRAQGVPPLVWQTIQGLKQ